MTGHGKHVSEIDAHIEGEVLVITLNRPQRRNALTPAMVDLVCEGLDQADDDDRIRAVIVTGAGSTFSAGADLSGGELTPRDELPPDRSERDYGGILALRLFSSTKPVIGAVNGDAVGLGSTMLLPMDARLAATTARFGFVFTRRGIVPEACSSWFLPRLVGIATATRWTMSGRVFPAAEALDAGLVDSLHEPGAVLDAAHAVARDLTAASSPLSVAATRRLLWQGLTVPHPMDAHRTESELVRTLARMPDAAEGIAAFLEKREARFTSRPSRDLARFEHRWPQPSFGDDQQE